MLKLADTSLVLINPSPCNVKTILFVIESCTTVTCSFTIDNVVDSATYGGKTLKITGDDLSDWTKEKSVTFESCYDCSPGTLSIKGSDIEVGKGI